MVLLSKPLLPPAKQSLGQGNIFAPVCHSVHRLEYLGRYTPRVCTSPRAGTPPEGTPPGQVQRPPPGRYTPLVGLECIPPPPRRTAGIRSTSGRYASYWNAYLFKIAAKKQKMHKYNSRSLVLMHLVFFVVFSSSALNNLPCKCAKTTATEKISF